MIDKITPKFLASDRDERLIEPGGMLDAQNVTLSQEGDGTSLIIKNAKGTIVASAASTNDAINSSREVRVIGAVTNDQRNILYFFVCGIGSSEDHGIYQYKTATNSYSEVLKESWLNFSESSFVKANVVNRNFQQDDDLQTVLYFTDNVNPPRKINVDRAGEADSFNLDNSYDHAFGVIKAPLIQPPSFQFRSDPSINVNNFTRSLWQFSVQLIYKDGEESALSPYSELAVSSTTGLEGLDDDLDLSGADFLSDNVIDITIPYSSEESNLHEYRPEVISMRLLGRDKNDGAWLILDEFNPNENLKRRVYGSNVNVYDKDSKIYTFYNEGIYSAVPDLDVNKTYDNVPLKAQGQAFVANRLMYSNYVEGFPNYPVPSGESSHNITVKYKEANEGSVLIESSNSTTVIAELGNGTGNIEIKPCAVANDTFIDADDTIDDGAVVHYEFRVEPSEFSLGGTAGDAELFWGQAIPTAIGPGEPNANEPFGLTLETADETITFVSENDNSFTISGDFVMPANSDIGDVLDKLVEEIDDEGQMLDTYKGKNAAIEGRCEAKLVYLGPHTSTELGYDVGETFDITGCRFDVLWKWSAEKDGDKVVVKPYPSRIRWLEGTVTSESKLQNASLSTYRNQGDLPTGSFISDWETATSVEISDNVPYEAQSQSGWPTYNATADNTSDYLQNELFQMETKGTVPTFKSGASHKLGIVYYDKYGRHGFVNDIGEFYVKSFQERQQGNEVAYGAAEAQITFNYNMPSWAERWSLVYGGNTSFDSAIQYTVGSAFTAVVTDNNTADESNKRVYVSLATLEKFEENKNPTFEYSFTKGDKLRVVSHRNSDNTDTVYPRASNTIHSPIEFNVVDVVTLGATNNPLTTTATAEDVFQGRFLVLDAPDVNGGATDSNGDTVKFQGFDWFTVTKRRHGANYTGTYPNGDTLENQGDNKWHQNCLVEIVSPKTTDTGVYYEIGVTGKKVPAKGGNTTHGVGPTINGAEYMMRTRSCATRKYASNTWGNPQDNVKKDMVFRNRLVETKDVSDFYVSDSWSKGKPHVKFERAAEVRRYNGITYSDAYEEDVAKLSLSSFNASLANFASVDSKYGPARYIENYNDDLICIQQNKLSLAGVGKDILETARDASFVSVSRNVIGAFKYYSGDYGVDNHPESVLIVDGDVFFADASRRKVLKFNPQSGGISPISDKGLANLFDSYFEDLEDATGVKKVVSGFDPKTDTYYITLHAKGDSGHTDRTVGYDMKIDRWISKYTFTPDIYLHQNRLMYSALNRVSGDDIFYRHDDNDAQDNRCKFYSGDTAASFVEVVSKENPSVVKTYHSVSTESSNEFSVTCTSSSGQQTGSMTGFTEREGAFYRHIDRANDISTDSLIGLGTVASVEGNVLTMTNSFRGIPIPIRSNISEMAEGQTSITEPTQRIAATNHGSKTITLDAGHGIVAGDRLFLRPNETVDGKPVRGNYCKIKASITSNTPTELYAINAHYSVSKHNHGLGQ